MKAIFANSNYGLYFGEQISFDTTTNVAVVKDCQHICEWYGRTGGITSLAAHGLCGADAGKSLVGAQAPGETTLTEIINVFPCSDEASETLEEAGRNAE